MLTGHNDFRQYYATASLIRQGRSNEIYNYDAQNALQRTFFPGEVIEGLPINHLAYEGLFFIPLTFLSYRNASTAWTVFNFLLIALSGLYLSRRYPRSVVFLSIVSFAPIMFTLILGQDTILLLLVYSVSMILFQKGREDLAGAILALGLFRYHLVLPFVFFLLLCGHRRFVKWFALTAIIPISVSLWLVGFEAISTYAQQVLGASRPADDHKYGLVLTNMPNLHGFLTLLTNGLLNAKVIAVISILCSLALLFFLSRTIKSINEKITAGLAATVLSSHYLYAYDLTLLALPVIIVLARRERSIATMAAIYILAAMPVYLLLGIISSVAFLAVPVAWVLIRSMLQKSPDRTTYEQATAKA